MVGHGHAWCLGFMVHTRREPRTAKNVAAWPGSDDVGRGQNWGLPYSN